MSYTLLPLIRRKLPSATGPLQVSRLPDDQPGVSRSEDRPNRFVSLRISILAIGFLFEWELDAMVMKISFDEAL